MKIERLYGRRPVYEALRAGRRKHTNLIIAEGINQTDIISDIFALARASGVDVRSAKRRQLDDLMQGVNHQGVALETSPYPFADIDAAMQSAQDANEPPFLLLLDLIQDVQNVGTLLRAADAVGVHGVIIQERRAADITPAVVSASSGAVEHLNVIQVTNLVRTMEDLKTSDVWFAGLDMTEASTRYDQAKLGGALGLVVGSEGKGLRRLVQETCDFIIHLPMRGQVASLNASTAGSIALYAAWQARGFSQ